MNIGIDFDNTIVQYDLLFYKVSVEQKLIPRDFPKSKLAIRDYLRDLDQENAWTELQGYVYGKRMKEAKIFAGVNTFFKIMGNNDHNLFIISHKTRYPFIGRKYDLHLSAIAWIKLQAFFKKEHIALKSIFFEETKSKKIQRIKECRCDYFIDDLPEIFLDKNFPLNTNRILFDPELQYKDDSLYEREINWDCILNHIISQ